MCNMKTELSHIYSLEKKKKREKNWNTPSCLKEMKKLVSKEVESFKATDSVS